MNKDKHYAKHPRCWYEPSCPMCYARAFIGVLKMRFRK